MPTVWMKHPEQGEPEEVEYDPMKIAEKAFGAGYRQVSQPGQPANEANPETPTFPPQPGPPQPPPLPELK